MKLYSPIPKKRPILNDFVSNMSDFQDRIKQSKKSKKTRKTSRILFQDLQEKIVVNEDDEALLTIHEKSPQSLNRYANENSNCFS